MFRLSHILHKFASQKVLKQQMKITRQEIQVLLIQFSLGDLNIDVF